MSTNFQPGENEYGKEPFQKAVIGYKESVKQEFIAACIRPHIFQQFSQPKRDRDGNSIAKKELLPQGRGLLISRSARFVRCAVESFFTHRYLGLLEARFTAQVWAEGTKGSCDRDATPEER
jgi:hypothetical protein